MFKKLWFSRHSQKSKLRILSGNVTGILCGRKGFHAAGKCDIGKINFKVGTGLELAVHSLGVLEHKKFYNTKVWRCFGYHEFVLHALLP